MVDPATDSWVKKIRVSSAGGASPLVAPQITIRPPGRRDRTECAQVAWPTVSITTSTRSGSRAPASKAWSAPSARARSRLASVRLVAQTRYPAARPSRISAVATPPLAPCTRIVAPGSAPDLANSILYAVRYAVGRQAASSKDSAGGLGIRLRRGTARRAAKVPSWRSDSRERRGSRVSSPPPASGSPMTACTMTGLPSGSIPAASQPRMMGSRSDEMPTPRRVHTSWWLRAAALTVTVTHPSGGTGSGRSPRSSPASGSAASTRAAVTASTEASLVEGMTPAQSGEATEVLVGGDDLAAVFQGERSEVRVGDEFAAGVGPPAQVREDAPELRTRANHMRLGLVADLVSKSKCVRDCAGHLAVEPAVGDDADHTEHREVGDRVRLGAVDQRPHPVSVLRVPFGVTPMGVDHHVHVHEHHRHSPPGSARCPAAQGFP